MTQNAPQAQDTEEDASSSISIGEIIRFVLQAARRHLLLGSALGILVAGLGITYALIVPSEYEARGKILFNQNASITPVIANPDRMMPRVDPLADVADIIQKKSNLKAIIKEVKLADQWEESRSPVLRVKDALMEIIRGPPTEEEKNKALIAMLEDAMLVFTEGANGLRIKVYWRDPVVAAKIVDLAMKRFLDAQLEEETAVISTAIEILQAEVTKAAKEIEPALQEVQRLSRGEGSEPAARNEDEEGKKAKPAVTYKRVTKPSAPKGPDPAMVERLQKTREAIRDIREPWQRRLADLKTQLNDLRGVYGPEHPAVVQQQRRINDARPEPPELARLRTEERNLATRIKSASEAVGDGETRLVAVGGGRAVDTDELSAVSLTSDRDPPELVAAKDRLRVATSKYNSVDKRLDGAELELTTAKTAFKYRYVVTEEPETPRKPITPNRPRLMAVSILAALMLGLIAGGARELLTGRFIEVWQVRLLGLPLLAEVASPPSPKPPPA